MKYFRMNHPIHQRCLRWLFFVCAAWMSIGVHAQDTGDKSPYEVWLNPGIFSYHFDRSKDLREDNTGIGAELMLSENQGLMGGTFINSNRARSHYAGYEWRPLDWQPWGIKVRAGIAVGGFDGYPNYHNGAWFPAALPMVSIEGGRVGVNVFVVPTIANRLDGAVAFQFKLRVW